MSQNEDEIYHEDEQQVPIEDRPEVRFFSVNQVGDLIKSRKNLVYMFRLSGEFIRVLPPTG